MRTLIEVLLIVVAPVLVLLVTFLRPMAKWIWKQPREHRWIIAREIARVLVKHRTSSELPQTEEEAQFQLPDEPVRTVPYGQWHRLDTLVANPRRITTLESQTRGASLDVDGSVVLVRRRDETTSDIGVLSPDGSARSITGPNGIVSAFSPSPNIDRGTVAWWQIALDGKSAELWVSQPGSQPRVLHTELTPNGRRIPLSPYGWVCVAGDQIAWTMLSGGSGTIGVTSMDGTTHRMGTTQFPTVHRDRAAERAGRRVVAVNIARDEAPVNGQVAQILLDGPYPELRVLRGGAFPGASVCEGSVVGYWKSTRTLQLPGGLWVHMPPASTVVDVISDGEWCAGNVFGAPDRTGGAVAVQDLFHLPTGARQRLCEIPFGIVDIRAGRILWTWKAEDSPDGAASSWVGDLRAPSPTVESGPTQAAPAN